MDLRALGLFRSMSFFGCYTLCILYIYTNNERHSYKRSTYQFIWFALYCLVCILHLKQLNLVLAWFMALFLVFMLHDGWLAFRWCWLFKIVFFVNFRDYFSSYCILLTREMLQLRHPHTHSSTFTVIFIIQQSFAQLQNFISDLRFNEYIYFQCIFVSFFAMYHVQLYTFCSECKICSAPFLSFQSGFFKC